MFEFTLLIAFIFVLILAETYPFILKFLEYLILGLHLLNKELILRSHHGLVKFLFDAILFVLKRHSLDN
jgi:hypothetical protein